MGHNATACDFKLLECDWCERGDLNPHGFPRQILSLVRLPIPPLSHDHKIKEEPFPGSAAPIRRCLHLQADCKFTPALLYIGIPDGRAKDPASFPTKDLFSGSATDGPPYKVADTVAHCAPSTWNATVWQDRGAHRWQGDLAIQPRFTYQAHR